MNKELDPSFTVSLGHESSELASKDAQNFPEDDPLGIKDLLEANRLKKEGTPADTVWGDVQAKIIAAVLDCIETPDQVAEMFEWKLAHESEIGKQSGMLFDFLASHGLKAPGLKYMHISPEGTFPEEIDAFRKRVLELNDPTKEELMGLVLAEIKQSSVQFEPMRLERVREDLGGVPEQVFMQRVKAGDAPLGVEEFVFNYLSDVAENVTMSRLKIIDGQTGIRLDLEQLLPDGYRFLPGQMRSVRKEFDEETNLNKNIVDTVDLNTYDGTQNAKELFYELPSLKIVSYGNLTKKGGRLGLLHEIAHAWQSKYHIGVARGKFETFFEKIMVVLERTGDYKNQEDWSDEVREEVFSDQTRRLAEMGVQIDEAFDAGERKPQIGEFKVSKMGLDYKSLEEGELKWVLKQYVIKSEKIKPLVEDFVREERDAWAHAIRVLRFLRKQGLDLEPELKTLKDIQDVVHYSLGTYQANIVEQVYTPDKVKAFTVKSRFNIDGGVNGEDEE